MFLVVIRFGSTIAEESMSSSANKAPDVYEKKKHESTVDFLVLRYLFPLSMRQFVVSEQAINKRNKRTNLSFRFVP